jgi:hypothetical protein
MRSFRLMLLASASCAVAAEMPGQRAGECPFPSPSLDAADLREVSWAANTISGSPEAACDGLRRTLARLRRPKNADEERVLLYVLDALHDFGAVVPPNELDFKPDGLLYAARLHLLMANGDPAATRELEKAFVELDASPSVSWLAVGNALAARRSARLALESIAGLTASITVVVGEPDRSDAEPATRFLCSCLPCQPAGWPPLPVHLFYQDLGDVVRPWVQRIDARKRSSTSYMSASTVDPVRARGRWLRALCGGELPEAPVMQVEVAADQVARLPALVAGVLGRADAWREQMQLRLMAVRVLPAAVALPAPELTIEDHRPLAERTAHPLPRLSSDGPSNRR